MKKKESKFSDYRRLIISKFEKNFDNEVAALPISQELSMINRSYLLVPGDYNSLYSSSMARKDS